MDLNVAIGYDQREAIAAEICKFSIQRRSPNVDVKFLKSQDLPEFNRPREQHQATDFTYTRFLVPYLNHFSGWSLFCDCDFLFCVPVEEIMQYADPSKAVFVVQHPEYVPRSTIKMDGKPQTMLFRKNWASLILFNNSHKSNAILTPQFINEITPGRRLHQFAWLRDEEIGVLPLEWNCLDDYYLLEKPKAIHYTDGGPWFANYNDTMYSHQWKQEHNLYLASLS